MSRPAEYMTDGNRVWSWYCTLCTLELGVDLSAPEGKPQSGCPDHGVEHLASEDWTRGIETILATPKKEYYYNFEPVFQVVYFNGSNYGAVENALYAASIVIARQGNEIRFGPCMCSLPSDPSEEAVASVCQCQPLEGSRDIVKPGQWVIIDANMRVFAQDDEPAWVEDYLWAIGISSGKGSMWAANDERTARKRLSWSIEGVNSLFRRPILRTGDGAGNLHRWFAPWEVVNH